jgi:hypothetical protein
MAMMVRLFGLVVISMCVASQASAAAPSKSALADMGLAGLEVMSDSESMSVRGFGYSGTSANGRSFAIVSAGGGAAGSQNSYSAKGGKFSAGANGSIAGVIVETGGGHGGPSASSKGGKGGHGGGHGGGSPKPVSIVAFGGGFSVASTKR